MGEIKFKGPSQSLSLEFHTRRGNDLLSIYVRTYLRRRDLAFFLKLLGGFHKYGNLLKFRLFRSRRMKSWKKGQGSCGPRRSFINRMESLWKSVVCVCVCFFEGRKVDEVDVMTTTFFLFKEILLVKYHTRHSRECRLQS